MNPLLQQLIRQSPASFPLEDDERVELLVACFLYANRNYSLGDEEGAKRLTFQELNTSIRKELNLSHPLKVCKKSRPELESELNYFVDKLKQLLQSKAVSRPDLSGAVRELYYTLDGNPPIPNEVSYLITGLLDGTVKTIYCPFGKSADFALHLPDHMAITTETELKDDVFYAKVQYALLDKSCVLAENDPIEKPKYTGDGGLNQFDAVISMPPLRAKLRSKAKNDIWGRFPENSLMGEVYFIRHMLAHTEKHVLCVVSNAFLYRSAAGERAFKEAIIENNWLEGVIALPTGLFGATASGLNVLVLNKTNANPRIKFMDASGDKFPTKRTKTEKKLVGVENILKTYASLDDTDELVHVLPDEIEANEYNLSPSRYIVSEGDSKLYAFLSCLKTACLWELVEIIRPQALKSEGQGGELFYEYGLSSLDEIGHVTGKPRLVYLNKRQLKRAEKQQIKPKDVLVVCKGGVGKVGFVPDSIKNPAVANQAFAILRVKELCRRMTPEALFQYLSSDYGKHHLKSLATGTTALMISSKDLSSMTVPALNKEQKQILAAVHKQAVKKQKILTGIKKSMKDLSVTALQSLKNYV